MIIAYPFCLRDQELALKNAQWWNELGGCKGHEVLCCYDARCTKEIVDAVGRELVTGFDKVWRLIAEAKIDGWPEGANYMFRTCTAWFQNKPGYPYFFWMEPDAIPTLPGWLDALETAYKRGGRPFMGDRVEVGDIPLHMSGVGVYQNPVYLLAGEAYRANEIAWDMAAKDQIVPHAYFTELIEHAWRHPQFHELSELETQIAPQTILFHSSKDGSLINLLREKRGRKHLSTGTNAQASNSVLPTTPKEPDKPGSPSPPTSFPVPVLAEPQQADSPTQKKRRQDDGGVARESTDERPANSSESNPVRHAVNSRDSGDFAAGKPLTSSSGLTRGLSMAGVLHCFNHPICHWVS
jgi:hypothetical protein